MAPRLRTLILKEPNESLDFDTCECVHKAHLSLHTETSYSIIQTKSFSRKSLRNPVREVLSGKLGGTEGEGTCSSHLNILNLLPSVSFLLPIQKGSNDT